MFITYSDGIIKYRNINMPENSLIKEQLYFIITNITLEELSQNSEVSVMRNILFQ